MLFLARANETFAQVIAVDEQFVLFSRAWCVSEIAAAHQAGMEQALKVHSANALQDHESSLRNLRIETMESTRPEDKEEILASIHDHAAFDLQLQSLLFEDLFPSWRTLNAV